MSRTENDPLDLGKSGKTLWSEMQALCAVCGAVGGFWFQYILQTFECISKANNSRLENQHHISKKLYI